MRAMKGLAFLLVICALTMIAGATTVYQTPTVSSGCYSPFWDDGSDPYPGAPGGPMGNEVTLAGTARYVTDVTVGFGTNIPDVTAGTGCTATFICTLYQNDGVGGAPGTVLASSSATSTGNSRAVPWNVSFAFADVLVPNTFTYAVSTNLNLSSSYGQSAYDPYPVGPMNATGAPTTGSFVDTIWWYKDGVWTSNATWAPILDGDGTNDFVATISADASAPVPEPITMTSLFLALGGLGGWIRRRAKVQA